MVVIFDADIAAEVSHKTYSLILISYFVQKSPVKRPNS